MAIGDRRSGTWGAGTFSFYPTKNMTTGEGGMITTADPEVADRARLLREHGMKVRYHHDVTGYNFRMSDIHASIGLARPTNPAMYGYISEHHGHGLTGEQSGEYAEDLAASMLASTLGIEFNPDAAWNERRKVYETSQAIIGSTSLTAASIGDQSGRWTCAVAAAVFRFA